MVCVITPIHKLLFSVGVIDKELTDVPDCVSPLVKSSGLLAFPLNSAFEKVKSADEPSGLTVMVNVPDAVPTIAR